MLQHTVAYKINTQCQLLLQSDSDVDAEETELTSTPRLISTGSTSDVDSLPLAAEGMVISQFRNRQIMNVVVTLPAAYYTFKIEYPKGALSVLRMCSFFLTTFSSKKSGMPISLDNTLSQLNAAE